MRVILASILALGLLSCEADLGPGPTPYINVDPWPASSYPTYDYYHNYRPYNYDYGYVNPPFIYVPSWPNRHNRPDHRPDHYRPSDHGGHGGDRHDGRRNH